MSNIRLELKALRPWAKAVLATLVVLLVVSGYVAITSHQNASEWQKQSNELEGLVKEADARNDKMIRELNEKTHLVNVSAAKLAHSQDDLKASEDDVKSLAARQKELANEKAHVEDQRAELIQIAASMGVALKSGQRCQSGLWNLIKAIGDGNYTYVQATVRAVTTICAQSNQQYQSIKGILE